MNYFRIKWILQSTSNEATSSTCFCDGTLVNLVDAKATAKFHGKCILYKWRGSGWLNYPISITVGDKLPTN